MSQVTFRRTISHLGPLQFAIIILAVATALVHLDRGLSTTLLAGHHGGPPPGGRHFAGGPPSGLSSILMFLPVLFYLNFVGYIVLIVALYLPLLRRYQRIIRWLLIVFTAVTILAWFLVTNASPNPLAYFDKPVEVALILLLLIEDFRTRSARG